MNEAVLEILESDIPLTDDILRAVIEKQSISFEEVYRICGNDSIRGDKLIMLLSGKRYVDIPGYGSFIKKNKMTDIAYNQHLLKNLFNKKSNKHSRRIQPDCCRLSLPKKRFKFRL